MPIDWTAVIRDWGPLGATVVGMLAIAGLLIRHMNTDLRDLINTNAALAEEIARLGQLIRDYTTKP